MHYTTATTATATTTTVPLHYTTLPYATPHYTTLHYATLHYATLHYTTLHCTTLHCTTLHYTTATLPYTRLHYTIPHYTHNTTPHDIALHYTTLLTPHHACNCNCACNYTTYTTLQLQLHYTTLQLQLRLRLRYTTLHRAVVVRWPLQPLQPLQKTQLQPPVVPSVDSPCHPWFTTTSLSYRFPIFETSASALCGTILAYDFMIFRSVHSVYLNVFLWIYMIGTFYIYIYISYSQTDVENLIFLSALLGQVLCPTWPQLRCVRPASGRSETQRLKGLSCAIAVRWCCVVLCRA